LITWTGAEAIPVAAVAGIVAGPGVLVVPVVAGPDEPHAASPRTSNVGVPIAMAQPAARPVNV